VISNLSRAAGPISILRQRNFGLIWSAISISQMGSQMEMIVVVWYVLNVTDSPFLVGLTAAARMGFNFLALFAGATADLLPRRTLMIIIQAILASLALVMLVLIVSGAVTLAAPLVMQRMHSDHGMHGDQSGHEVQGAHAAHTSHAGMNMDMDHDQAADHSMMSHGESDHEMNSHMVSGATYPDMPMSMTAESAGDKPMESDLNQGAVHFDQTSPAEPLSDPLDQIDQDAAQSFDQMSPEQAAP